MSPWEYAPGAKTMTHQKGVDQQVLLSYEELSVNISEGVVVVEVGNRTADMFLDPNHFPMRIDGEKINVKLLYGTEKEELTVQAAPESYVSAGPHDNWNVEASMETIEMDKYQQMVAFLYLVGKVMNTRKA